MYLHTERHGSTLIWQLDRPESLNALGPTMGHTIKIEVDRIVTDCDAWKSDPESLSPPCRLLVIKAKPVSNKRGRTPIWIAGGDLKELNNLKTPEEGRAYASLFADICAKIASLPIPSLAYIDGLVIGGGAELALATDFRIATERSEFHWKQLSVGLSTGYASCQRLLDLIGLARSTELMLLCKNLKASEALRLGLVNECVEDTSALDHRLAQLAQHFEALSPLAVAAQKKMLNLRTANTLVTDQELDIFASLWMKDAHKQFLKTFF